MSDGSPLFLDEPWGLLSRTEEATRSAEDCGAAEICGRGSPRAVTRMGAGIKWGGGLGVPPTCSLPFRWRGGIYTSSHLPCTHLPLGCEQSLPLTWTAQAGGSMSGLTQRNVMTRPGSSEEKPSDSAVSLEIFVNWLLNSFQELGHGELEGLDCVAGGLVRRTWDYANRVWLDPDGTEPRIELIIRMAQDQPLLRALESISLNPRRILLRVREKTPLARVQEMDAGCIRYYARQPGRTAIQKAGTRQVLLSVQRSASHDTLENRVACWTLANLRKRAVHWKRLQTEKARASQRSRAVSSLAKQSAIYGSAEALSTVRHHSLTHPVHANYPLMMEHRYKRVYRAYRELLKYQKITDEGWTWRRVLWSEGVSQLVSCALRRIWSELHGSSAYYRTEPDRGRWTVAPCAAGPFRTPRGAMFVVDSHEFESVAQERLVSCLPERSTLSEIGLLGCDMALWWPHSDEFVAIWPVLWTGPSEDWPEMLGRAAAAVNAFRAARRKMAERAGRISGIVVSTATAISDIELDEGRSGDSSVCGLRLPMRIDTQDAGAFARIVKNLQAGIEMAVGASAK